MLLHMEPRDAACINIYAGMWMTEEREREREREMERERKGEREKREKEREGEGDGDTQRRESASTHAHRNINYTQLSCAAPPNVLEVNGHECTSNGGHESNERSCRHTQILTSDQEPQGGGRA